MFHFFQTIFNKIISVVVSAIITIGLVSVPQATQTPQQINNDATSTILVQITPTTTPIAFTDEMIGQQPKKSTTSITQETQATNLNTNPALTPTPSLTPVPTTLIITSPSSIPSVSESSTPEEIEELQKHQDENQIDMTTIITPPPSSPTCRTDADLVWDDSQINNNLDEFIYFWFPENQYYIKDNFPYFAVKNNDGKITVNIPVEIVNKKNFPVTYKLLYWISDVSNITVGLTEIKSTALPIIFDLPQDYYGHKVSFQLFFYYDCVSRIGGPNLPGIKALNNSILTLDIPSK